VGADEALTELITDSGDWLLRLAYQLTHDRSAAEDVVQEALMRLYKSWRRDLPMPESTRGYARRAVVNEFLRRQRLRAATELITSDGLDGAEQSFDTAVVDRDHVWRALADLPLRQRTVLVLRYYEDLPDAQIAELIDAKEATVRSLAARGIATVRKAAMVEVSGR
jgi:RNA polymerase sigma-70 factor (sigma-E family)